MPNRKGAAHILAVFVIVLGCLIALNLFLKNGSTDSTKGIDGRDRDSVEFIRQTAYTLIEAHSSLMKMQVDMAVRTWDSMTPEQKQQVREYILKTLESEMNRGRSLFGRFLKEGIQGISPSQPPQSFIGGQ